VGENAEVELGDETGRKRGGGVGGMQEQGLSGGRLRVAEQGRKGNSLEDGRNKFQNRV